MKFVLASRNPKKIAELRTLLSAHLQDAEVLSLDDVGILGEIEENGATFEENALIKARAVAQALGVAAAADDSGLEVDALGGAPGVYSARYSEDWPAVEGESKDERNNRKLLTELEGVPMEKRTARFRCAMALVLPDGKEMVVNGAWEGHIGFSEAGENGFGYDPLFIDPELELTGAELTREAKMVRSHRGKALARLLAEVEERGL